MRGGLGSSYSQLTTRQSQPRIQYIIKLKLKKKTSIATSPFVSECDNLFCWRQKAISIGTFSSYSSGGPVPASRSRHGRSVEWVGEGFQRKLCLQWSFQFRVF